ncbi:MAG: hypothetical protein PHR15_07425 [Atopobiaceae bacterium]|jgi:hypothetical protein|nr:hypothetical protein [Atopobiaceae bacterium]MCH4180860.1 hypothetical protein [Atopobiaceae bacterium]MCH4213467.1 hypothetical protein [Atopobiaceae bacterium]MCH4277136.1 hypothetical protein [Atopobiaceae bacterium]MCI1226443.1 hypothetical protein [Atopobiaceae bacterium]
MASDTHVDPKPLESYLLNKCLIGYGLINGIINALIFFLLHMGDRTATFSLTAILMDLALTGFLLGLLLYLIVAPMTRSDLRKGSFSTEGARQLGFIPAGTFLASLVVGAVCMVVLLVVGGLLALVLPQPLSFTGMLVLKGCLCAVAGAIAGYLTINKVAAAA